MEVRQLTASLRHAACALCLVMPAAAYAFDLGAYLWTNRPLLAFTPAESTPGYADAQAALTRAARGVRDRDIVLIVIEGRGSVRASGQSGDADSAAALRTRFAAPDHALTFVLLGKDGGEKARQTGRLDLDALFERVDAMPMRRREMMELVE